MGPECPEARYLLPDTSAHQKLAADYPLFSLSYGKPLRPVLSSEPGYHIDNRDEAGAVNIHYDSLPSYFRGLGELLTFPDRQALEGKAVIPEVGVLFDVSRGGIPNDAFLADLNQTMALAGMNTGRMYMEYFEVDGYPELQEDQRSRKEIAAAMQNAQETYGIAWSGATQTLGHASRILQHDSVRHLAISDNAFNPDEPTLYPFLKSLVHDAATMFPSDMINIGCDEAMLFGVPADRVAPHLQRMEGILEELGLQGEIWHDLLPQIPESELARVPRSFDVNVWNYGSHDREIIGRKLRRYKDLGFAGVRATAGAQTWNRYYALLDRAMMNLDEIAAAVKQEEGKGMDVSIWGDDGTEVAWRSAFPAIIYAGEHAWQETVSREDFQAKLQTIIHASAHELAAPVTLDTLMKSSEQDEKNLAKILIHENPLKRTFTAAVPAVRFRDHYEALYTDLSRILRQAHPKNVPMFAFTVAIADYLRFKADLGNEAYTGYHEQDSNKLNRVLEKTLSAIDRGEVLKEAHRTAWITEREPQGFMTIRRRYEETISRLEHFYVTVQNYVKGEASVITEFEDTRSENTHFPDTMVYYAKVAA